MFKEDYNFGTPDKYLQKEEQTKNRLETFVNYDKILPKSSRKFKKPIKGSRVKEGMSTASPIKTKSN